VSGRLPPAEWWPAGVAGVAARRLTLADGSAVRIVEAGPVSGAPVLLVHGWGVTAYLWRHNVLPLAAAGHRVIAMDLPGCGLSDVPTAAGGFTLEKLSAGIGAVLDALGIQRAAIVGQSMGGKIVTQFAIDHPERVRTLVLFGPVGFGLIPPWQALAPALPPLPADLYSWIVPRAMVAFVQHRVYGKLGWFSERDVDEYWAPTQFPEVVKGQFQALREFSWGLWDKGSLAKLRTKTHVVFGTRDRTVRPRHAEELAAALPNGRLTWIKDGGHVVMEEVADRVNAMLLDDLRE
jgi:pimeloyl-ACP methyl ester carboxylesterase